MSSWDNVLDGLSTFTGEFGKSLAMMQAGTSMMNDIDSVVISDFCDHNGYNYKTMLRHINLTISQFSFLTSFTGANAAAGGIGTNVSKDNKLDYTYTQGIDYVNNYQETISSKERQGLDTTSGILGGAMRDYLGSYRNINQLYQTSANLYPDDNDSGIWGINGGSKWKTSSNFGLLYKTKKLFKERKINTIISRFHTENKDAESTTSETSAYGLSHGRNLLTYDAETTGSRYPVNGYDNPYCRVWTHHHKYDAMSKLIRPFVEDVNVNRSDLNRWGKFEQQSSLVLANKVNTEAKNEKLVDYEEKKWGWRVDGADSYKHSVLNHETGMLNIAPQFKGGGEYNIHTKDCMFSIENLAWQGYDPYSFENALSWEQRGPFGGRIMWFPPYGLSFNEDTSVNWNEHTFIGRGESVYTYTNTSRSGSLSFKLVVDHPSIIDYATWYKADANETHDVNNPQNTLTDTDILRFFAGCEKPGVSLTDKAKPTPLTDEYIKEDEEKVKQPKDEEPIKKEPEQDNTNEPTDEETIDFYVFFPNNYSGHYDRAGVTFSAMEYISPIEYLLFGNGAQENFTDVNFAKTADFGYHCPLGTLKIEKYDEDVCGYGYEMNISKGISSDINENTNYIMGIDNNFQGTKVKKWNAKKKKNYYVNVEPKTYTQGKYGNFNKRWYYRIDGCYSLQDGKTNWSKSNCYGHTLPVSNQTDFNKRYKDLTSNSLNSNYNSLCENKINGESDDIKNKTYTLAEIAYAVYKNNGKNDFVNLLKSKANFIGNLEENERFRRLEQLLTSTDYKIAECNVIGESNKEGANTSEVNKNRNEFLAKERAETICDWINTMFGGIMTSADTSDNTQATKAENKTTIENAGLADANFVKNDESHITQKIHRCAKATLKFKRVKISENVTQNAKSNSWDFLLNNQTVNDIIKAGIDSTSDKTTNYERTLQQNENGTFENSGMIPATGPNGELIMWKRDANGNGMSDTEKYITQEELNALNELNENTNYGNFGDGDYVKYIGLLEKYGGYTQKMVKDTRQWQEVKDKDGTTKMVASNIYSRFSGVDYRFARENNLNTKNGNEFNHLRYDQEYYFFKQLELNDKPMYDSLVKKLHFFNPAFHSMTPEGFMGRLTFLQQCTRQGNTIGASDENGKSANNLAFGRPPFCVLRLGDFYYQKIVIKSISINYDPLVWDMNHEGAGVVPMLADVTINFNFIGGGDMTGAVRRLQNAMSFNYYANTRLYDNRADRVTYKYDHKTNGALDHSLDLENSDLYLTKMFK